MDEKVVSTQFDALLLDEAQDYLPQEIELLRRLTDVLVATADSRQRIYDVADCSSTLSQHIANCYPLIYHFRNGLDICRVADGIMKGTSSYSPMVDRSNYDENAYPSKVKPRAGLSIEQQAAAIAEQIREQRFAYPTELIGVLCPRNDEVDAIEAGLQAAGLGPLITRANKGLQFDPTRPIWLSTLTAAKGLEFRAVHIAGLDHLARMGSVQKRLIYTGVTRAKTALTLYWESQIPGYLDTALRQVDSSTRVVTKQNLFGMS
jgi:superfamily I DNA/RNA helicase